MSPRPVPLPISWRLSADELAEDLLAFGRRNARTVVDDREPHGRAVRRTADLDRALRSSVQRRVLEEVGEHVIHEQDVDVDGGELGGDRELHPLMVERARATRGQRLHDVDRRGGGTFWPHGAAANPSRLDHLVDEALEASRLAPRVLEQLSSFVLVQTRRRREEHAARSLDRGERRAQIVGEHGEHGGAGLVELAPDSALARSRVESFQLDRRRHRARRGRGSRPTRPAPRRESARPGS